MIKKEKISEEDLSILQQIIENKKDEINLLSVIDKLSGKEVLGDILSKRRWIMPYSAYEALVNSPQADQSTLAYIAKTRYPICAKKAVEKLTDEVLLSEVANVASLDELRGAAARKLPKNHPVIAIILPSIDEVRKQTNSNILTEIARKASDPYVRAAAVSNPNLMDEKFLSKLAGWGYGPEVEAAIRRHIDSDELAKIAKRGGPTGTRQTALLNPNLTKQKVFSDLALDKNHEISTRLLAVERLTDLELLMGVAKHAELEQIRSAAVLKMPIKSKSDPRDILDAVRNKSIKTSFDKLIKKVRQRNSCVPSKTSTAFNKLVQKVRYER